MVACSSEIFGFPTFNADLPESGIGRWANADLLSSASDLAASVSMERAIIRSLLLRSLKKRVANSFKFAISADGALANGFALILDLTTILKRQKNFFKIALVFH